MRHHHGPHCRCPVCVHPTKVNNVHTCSESTVKHIHPSHTNVINHHTVKNVHEYPHSTSYQNVTNSVDIQGPSYQVPAPQGVMGAQTGPCFGPGGMGPGGFGPGGMAPGGMGPGSGVMGAQSGPGFGPGGCGPGTGVMGAQSGPGYSNMGPGQGVMGAHHMKPGCGPCR